jgi:hypothetical protein
MSKETHHQQKMTIDFSPRVSISERKDAPRMCLRASTWEDYLNRILPHIGATTLSLLKEPLQMNLGGWSFSSLLFIPNITLDENDYVHAQFVNLIRFCVTKKCCVDWC